MKQQILITTVLLGIACSAACGALAKDGQPISTTQPECVDLNGAAAQPNPLDKDGRVTHFKAPAIRLMRTVADKPKGVALIFPSGAYHVLSVVSDGTEKAKFWNDLGYDAAILEYTISEKSWNRDDAIRARALQDALAAVRLVRGKAKELGLREGSFVMMGGSAGGHLAARTVAALPEKERPYSLVLFYPAYLEEVPPGGKQPGLLLPVGKLPRLFAAIATNDDPKWVAGARAYADAWNKAPGGAGRATFHLFDDGFHGFRKGSRAAAQWPDLLKSFDTDLPSTPPAAKLTEPDSRPGAGPFTTRPPYQDQHIAAFAKRRQIDQQGHPHWAQ